MTDLTSRLTILEDSYNSTASALNKVIDLLATGGVNVKNLDAPESAVDYYTRSNNGKSKGYRTLLSALNQTVSVMNTRIDSKTTSTGTASSLDGIGIPFVFPNGAIIYYISPPTVFPWDYLTSTLPSTTNLFMWLDCKETKSFKDNEFICDKADPTLPFDLVKGSVKALNGYFDLSTATYTTDNNRILNTTEFNVIGVFKYSDPTTNTKSTIFKYNNVSLRILSLPSEHPAILTNQPRLCLCDNDVVKCMVSIVFNTAYIVRIKVSSTACSLNVSGYTSLFPTPSGIVIVNTAAPLYFSLSDDSYKSSYQLGEFIIINGSIDYSFQNYLSTRWSIPLTYTPADHYSAVPQYTKASQSVISPAAVIVWLDCYDSAVLFTIGGLYQYMLNRYDDTITIDDAHKYVYFNGSINTPISFMSGYLHFTHANNIIMKSVLSQNLNTSLFTIGMHLFLTPHDFSVAEYVIMYVNDFFIKIIQATSEKPAFGTAPMLVVESNGVILKSVMLNNLYGTQTTAEYVIVVQCGSSLKLYVNGYEARTPSVVPIHTYSTSTNNIIFGAIGKVPNMDVNEIIVYNDNTVSASGVHAYLKTRSCPSLSAYTPLDYYNPVPALSLVYSSIYANGLNATNSTISGGSLTTIGAYNGDWNFMVNTVRSVNLNTSSDYKYFFAVKIIGGIDASHHLILGMCKNFTALTTNQSCIDSEYIINARIFPSGNPTTTLFASGSSYSTQFSASTGNFYNPPPSGTIICFGLERTSGFTNLFIWEYETDATTVKGIANANITAYGGVNVTADWYPHIIVYNNSIGNVKFEFLPSFTIANWLNILS
jgi:hypothetical protein